MKNLALALLLQAPLMAFAQTEVPPPVRALLQAPDAQCRAELKLAAGELAGRPFSLADDVFTKSDSLVLATVGQSASGRMLPPSMVLHLTRGAMGCRLTLDSAKKSLDLKTCLCEAAPAKTGY